MAGAAELCRDARPKDLLEVDGPERPPDRLPAYDAVALVVVDLWPLEGDLVAAPDRMVQRWGDRPTDNEGSGFGEIARLPGPEADLLVCVDLRVTDVATYSGGSRFALADQLAWPVDAKTGERVGDPWLKVAPEGFPSSLRSDEGVPTGLDYRLLSTARVGIALDSAVLVDRVVPVAGVFQGSAYHGFTNPAPDAPFLVEGTSMSGGESFVVRLVFVDDGSATIDFVEVFCAPDDDYYGNAIRLPPIRVATDVTIELGRFRARNEHVRIRGFLTAETRAEGTIEALSKRARACGVPKRSSWEVFAARDVTTEPGTPSRRLLATRAALASVR